MPIPFGGDRITFVSEALAAGFTAGDRLVVVQSTGDLLHIPAAVHVMVDEAVAAAREAFAALARVEDAAIEHFYEAFSARLADDTVFASIAAANTADVDLARSRGRSTTRLVLDAKMRLGMIDGLRAWAEVSADRDGLVDTRRNDGWVLERRRAGLGVVGFVFEGRPNVFADAVGVLKSGNTVVFRIGSDALGTARAIVEAALRPALEEAGLPTDSARLVESPERSAGWALFANTGLALAVARGSGAAVEQLGAVARQTGTPVSLHGTGGGWMVAGRGADASRFERALRWSLDRKVCNTVTVCCVPASRAPELVPRLLAALDEAAAARGAAGRLHVVDGSQRFVPENRFTELVSIERADGAHEEPFASVIAETDLAHEWEWENSPELSLAVVDDLDDAIALFNRHSPRLVASLISEIPAEQAAFWNGIDAPFVGDGMTRWVDGQYALGTPELGLSNWQDGRLFGRGGVLSGDGVFTLRYRALACDPELHR